MKQFLPLIALGIVLGLGTSACMPGATSPVVMSTGESRTGLGAFSYPTETFVIIDRVGLGGDGRNLVIAGTFEDQDAVVESEYRAHSELVLRRCERLALFALEQPGRYRFTITSSDWFIDTCQLARNQ